MKRKAPDPRAQAKRAALNALKRVQREAVRAGVKIKINQNYALRDVIDAHRALEARATTGSTVFSV